MESTSNSNNQHGEDDGSLVSAVNSVTNTPTVNRQKNTTTHHQFKRGGNNWSNNRGGHYQQQSSRYSQNNQRRNKTVLINPRYKGCVQVNENNGKYV